MTTVVNIHVLQIYLPYKYFYFSELLRQSDIRNDLNANFESVFTNQLMGLYLSTNDTKSLYEDIKNHYLLGKDYINISNPDSIQGFIDVSKTATRN